MFEALTPFTSGEWRITEEGRLDILVHHEGASSRIDADAWISLLDAGVERGSADQQVLRIAVAYLYLLRAAKELRRLDTTVAQMSDTDLLDPAVIAGHLAAVREASEEMDAAIEAAERASEPLWD